MSWVEKKAREVADAAYQGDRILSRADIEQAIRETIQKCAEVAEASEIVGQGGVASDPRYMRALDYARDAAVGAILKLVEP